MNINISNAAHAYGLDDMSQAGSANLGSISSIAYSADLSTLQVGQSVGGAIYFTNGFVESVTGYVSSYTSYTITGIGVARIDNGQPLLSVSGNLTVGLSNLSSVATLSSIYGGNDNITGNDYNNVLEGYGGNDVINGGAGTDTVYMRGLRSQYTVTKGSNGLPTSISGGIDGTDTLIGIERIKYSDVTVAYDTNGAAGQAYRLYQAALNRTPDQAGLGDHIRGLDRGMSLSDIANIFINSAEFTAKYGAGTSNTTFVTQLYSNVLHRAPDAGGLAGWVSTLDHNSLSRADVLVGFSESAENQAALIGTISQGMVYAG